MPVLIWAASGKREPFEYNQNRGQEGREIICSALQPLYGILLFDQTVQLGPQDQKSVTFSHSVISLNQLLKNSKNTGQNISLPEYYA